MPLMEYECSNGHKTERLASKDTTMIQCPACKLPALRVISAASIKRDGAYSWNDTGKKK